jgi:hypothetical protein
MSSEHDTAVSLDAHGVPIALELQVFAEPEADSSESPETDAQQPSDSETLTGYELVADMMRRQDDVINQLDDLNARIESAIAEISASRKSEIMALDSELEDDSTEESVQKAA